MMLNKLDNKIIITRTSKSESSRPFQTCKDFQSRCTQGLKALAKRFQHFVEHLLTLSNDVEVRDGQTHSTYSTVGEVNINIQRMFEQKFEHVQNFFQPHSTWVAKRIQYVACNNVERW